MTRMERIPVVAAALSLIVAATPLPAQDVSGDLQDSLGPERGAPVTPFVFDGDLRELPAPPEWRPGDPVKEIPRRFYPPPGATGQYTADPGPFGDPLLDSQRAAPRETSGTFTTPSRNFAGQGYTGVNPPDTVGDVGPNHYIQAINSGGGARVRIYDKAEPAPSVLTTFNLDNLGSGYCASGLGDPIVLYDRLADRWLISEFSAGGNRLCVYISQTNDPVSGGWYNYNYQAPSFPDYPKYAVWPTDANGGDGSYIVTANDGGRGSYALDRGAMLSGAPGTYLRFTTPGLSGFGFEALTPVDVDGPNPPPPGTPAVVMRHRDTEVHSGPSAPADLIELWAFDVDWIDTGNTTFTQLPSIDVAEFDSSLCGLTSFSCFRMPNTSTRLDPLREVIMFRAVYMNHDDHESLAGNFVVDVGINHGGIRWFELRRGESGDWELYQEGTYSIDGDSRWMGASAMDQSGNFALAYSVSSSATYPSLRYTGRLATDALGVMTQAETDIHAGTASNSSNRWGDYAAMNLDPSDDCTFWFTSLDNTSSNWRTQIASFRFEACGCLAVPSPPVAEAAPAGDNRIDVTWNDSLLSGVTEYRVRRALVSGGPYETIATVADSSPSFGGGPGYVYGDTDVSGGTTYYYTVVATDGVACTSDPSHETSATATGDCMLAPTFGGIGSATNVPATFCTVNLSWDSASTDCPGPITYTVYRDTISPVAPTPANQISSALADEAYTDAIGLVSGTTYHYVVRAVEGSTGREDSNATEAFATPYFQDVSFSLEPCLTGGVAPPAVPDGQAATEPLRGERMTSAGDVIDVTWDAASCPATDYNLIYGDLAGVATYTLDGAECTIGTAGDFTWSDVPAGDLFFLIVGTDGADTESSWGTDSGLNERNGAAPSETCSIGAKDTSATCP
jgi:hypothetical protein